MESDLILIYILYEDKISILITSSMENKLILINPKRLFAR